MATNVSLTLWVKEKSATHGKAAKDPSSAKVCALVTCLSLTPTFDKYDRLPKSPLACCWRQALANHPKPSTGANITAYGTDPAIHVEFCGGFGTNPREDIRPDVFNPFVESDVLCRYTVLPPSIESGWSREDSSISEGQNRIWLFWISKSRFFLNASYHICKHFAVA